MRYTTGAGRLERQLHVVAQTDVGQLLKISKETVVVYFRNHLVIMFLSEALFGVALYINRRFLLVRGWVLGVFGAFFLGCFVVTKYLVPYVVFPAQQHHAEYRSVADVVEESYLLPDDTAYVIAHNDVTRAFPQKYLWVSHIFGGDYGGEEVVLTYCVLTNLSIPYVNDLDGEAMDLKVLAQTLPDAISRGGSALQPLREAAREVAGRADAPRRGAFRREVDVQYRRAPRHAASSEGESDRDPRRPGGRRIYVRLSARGGIVNTRVGDQRIVVAHVPEHDIFVAFDRMKSGEDIEVTEVDVFGNTPDHGQLEPAFIYNSPMWAVWLHYYPHTKLFK